ncbi:hypothetical protein [Peribacillus deserti]|uniref:hypothetical protein n=1 Tax=Peribacillus deserti TaxID=673318 RepID=UPI0015E0AEC5|nr:hypothetical protein [Peribacillus deserti]
MNGDAILAVFPFLTLLFYIAPVIFIIWFLVRMIRLQEEKNKILRNISEKLDTQR